MERIDLHKMFMNIALEVSKRSTCTRVNVGALIVKNQRIISMGWNGVPSGKQHCSDHFYNRFMKEKACEYSSNIDLDKMFNEWINTSRMKEEHHNFAIRNEIHGEMNAILAAAKAGISIDGADLYVTWSPCIDCAKSLLQIGIKNVYYNYKYDREPLGIDFLEENGVKCWEIK